MSKTIKVNGKEYDVVSTSRGWVKYMDDGGSIRSVRASKADKPAKVAKPKAAAKPAKAKPVAAGVRTIGNTEVDLSHYQRVKTAGGNTSFDNGDKVAKELRELKLDEIYKLVSKVAKEDLEAANMEEAEKILRKKYSHLNPGMQRMNLGNRYRAAVR